MSLKAFHIVFVVASVILVLGLGAWSLEQYRETGAGAYLAGTALAAVSAAALLVYGRYFLRKLKHISFL